MKSIIRVGGGVLAVAALAWAGLHWRSSTPSVTSNDNAISNQALAGNDQRQEPASSEDPALQQARDEYLRAKAAYEADYDRYAKEREFVASVAGQVAANGGTPPAARGPDPYLQQRYQLALRRYQELGGQLGTFELPGR